MARLLDNVTLQLTSPGLALFVALFQVRWIISIPHVSDPTALTLLRNAKRSPKPLTIAGAGHDRRHGRVGAFTFDVKDLTAHPEPVLEVAKPLTLT
jgi:hypothetical protein